MCTEKLYFDRKMYYFRGLSANKRILSLISNGYNGCLAKPPTNLPYKNENKIVMHENENFLI